MSSIPPTSRKRKHPDATPPPISIFDTLPYDALAIIIRYISKRPYVDNWQDYFDLPQLLTVLKTDGRLNPVARDLVTQLGQLSHIRSPAYRETEAAILHHLISRLSTLKVRWSPIRNVPRFSLQFHTIPLRELYIQCRDTSRKFPFNRILSACGVSLRKLQICATLSSCGSIEINSIARHCRQLQTLDIYAYELFEEELFPLWPAVGANLTRLRICSLIPFRSESTRLMRVIALNCIRLQDIELKHPQHVWLYKKIGPKLKVIRFLSLPDTIPNQHELIEILECCPNVEIHAHLRRRDFVEDRLKILSNRLSVLTMYHDSTFKVPQLPILKEAILGIPRDQITFAESFFAGPRPALRKLTLSCIKAGDILNIVAKSATCLRELSLDILDFGDSFRNNDCDQLITANPELRKFRIEYSEVYSDEREGFTKMSLEKVECITVAQLKCLRDCMHLAVFEVIGVTENKRSTLIDNSCVALRSRQVFVEIGGVQYLPA